MSSLKRSVIKKSALLAVIFCIIFSLTALVSSAAYFNDNDVMCSENAGDHLCTLSGRKYYKAYDGWAIVGYFYCDSGYSGPILVGKTAESVAYTTTWDSTVWESIGTVEQGGETYYYSAIKYFMSGNHNNTADHSLYKCGGGQKISVENAALELLSKWCMEHEGAWETTVVADCHTDGERQRVCEKCGELEIENTGYLHQYGDWAVTQPAACETKGKESRECSACGAVEELDIDALNHRYGELTVVSGNVVIPPIVKEKTCTACGAVETYNDWGYVWVTVIVGIVAVLGVIG